MMSVIGDVWKLNLNEEEKNELKAEQAKRHSEFTKRLEIETDKAFDPICLPIAPVALAEGRDNIEYKAMEEEYLKLKSEYEAIENMRSEIKSKNQRARYSAEKISEKDKEEERRFSAYKSASEAYAKRHEELYSSRRLMCEAVLYLQQIVDRLDSIESALNEIADSEGE